MMMKTLRKSKNLSQQEISDKLGINRALYSLSENGKRPRREEEIEKLSEIFDVSSEVILGSKKLGLNQKDIAVSSKFEKLLLYILTKVGIKPNIGKTVLYKLLYFCDFDYYELYGESISGIEYIKLPRGPAPYQFDILIEKLHQQKKILIVDQEYQGYYQKKYYPNVVIQNSELSQKERDIVDDVLVRLGDMNATQVSEYSHGDIPRIQTKDMEKISYELVSNRNYPYSASIRQQKKQEAFIEMQSTGVFDDLKNEPDLYNDY